MSEEDPAETLKNIGALEAAEDRAFKRGQSSAKLASQVEAHEHRLNAINGSIERAARAHEATNERLDQLTESVRLSTAVAKAQADTAAELAAKTARKTVDKRTFVISLVLATTAIAGVLFTAVQLAGHG